MVEKFFPTSFATISGCETFYDRNDRLTIFHALLLLFIMHELLSGQILSTLLKQPLSRYNTFKELYENQDVKLYTNNALFKDLILYLARETGESQPLTHLSVFKNIAERLIVLPREVLSPEKRAMDMSSGRVVAILPSLFVEEFIDFHLFLKMIKGEESFSEHDFVFILSNPTGRYNKDINKMIKRLLQCLPYRQPGTSSLPGILDSWGIPSLGMVKYSLNE